MLTKEKESLSLHDRRTVWWGGVLPRIARPGQAVNPGQKKEG